MLVFLLLPVVVVIPLSFNAEPFFSFTEGMLKLEPRRLLAPLVRGDPRRSELDPGDQEQLHHRLLRDDHRHHARHASPPSGWRAATCRSGGSITALLLSPMIVPLIIIAAGIFFFYSRFDLIATYPGVIIAHAALGVPFVVITVTATLAGFDRSMYNAGLSLGANPLRTFRDVVFPLIRPGVISGAVFAFVTSFDEVVVILFIAGPDQRTIPRQMFSGLREQINPTILAVATLLVVLSIALLATLELLRRPSQATSTAAARPETGKGSVGRAMTILVTGSAGHLGEALMRRLRAGRPRRARPRHQAVAVHRPCRLGRRPALRRGLHGRRARRHSRRDAAQAPRRDPCAAGLRRRQRQRNAGAARSGRRGRGRGLRLHQHHQRLRPALDAGRGRPTAWVTRGRSRRSPKNIYGATKLAAEGLVRAVRPPRSGCR